MNKRQRKKFSSKLECRTYAVHVFINTDTGELTCYHNGKHGFVALFTVSIKDDTDEKYDVSCKANRRYLYFLKSHRTRIEGSLDNLAYEMVQKRRAQK